MTTPLHHSIDWFEIPVANLQRAMKFYEAISGRKLHREPFGAPGDEIAVFEVDSDDGLKGALLSSPQAQPSAHGTIVYLNANPSIDAWLGRVQHAGGKVSLDKTALPPGMGFMAHIMDSEGNKVGLHAAA
jgi:uncharacterized protein